LTEQVIAALASVQALRVISPESVAGYRRARKSVPEIARELRVDAVLDGTVLADRDNVRLTIRLFRGSTGDVVWTQGFDRPQRDVLSLPGDVARAVTTHADLALPPGARARVTSVRHVDPEVNRLFLLGRFHAGKATREGLDAAVGHFQQAIERDGQHALAYASLAETYTAQAWFGNMSPREAMPRARAAAEAALQRDASLAEAHAALGAVRLFFEWDGPAAERSLRRAIQLNPSLPSARLTYAGYLLTAARIEESVEEVRRAVDLDPLSIRTHALATMFLIFGRRYDEAIAQANKARQVDPRHGLLAAFEGLAATEQGRHDEAVAHLQRAMALDRTPTIVSFGAHVHAAAGQKSKARELIREAEQVAGARYFCPYEVATAYLSLGETDTAVEWFRRGIAVRADCMAWLGVEPWLDGFRNDPRYRQLLREVGLAPGTR
jgi:tetratricopeptide (TPR) repeat protein